ncbi:hypothetical protein M3Y99_00239600 [Aphelenchoides fujianensis]|nr:hypothetical protein M3Y99_00239600 [Aphelenchoides fujianensis]
MEAAVVKRKPRMRAAVRGGLNRFSLLAAKLTDESKTGTQLIRLAAISRAQLPSLRNSVRGIKFAKIGDSGVSLMLDLGPARPAIELHVAQTEVVGIVKLLNAPVHLDWRWIQHVNWEMWLPVEEFVTGLTVRPWNDSPVFLEFADRVAPHLKELECSSSFLTRFPPLDLDKLVIKPSQVDYEVLQRHKLRRLDVPIEEVEREFSPDLVLSASITALGLRNPSVAQLSSDSIELFCRRFPALEDLHFTGSLQDTKGAFADYFKELWSECLKFRDRVDIPGLKRLFFTFNDTLTFLMDDPKPDWWQTLKQTAPFDQAVFWVDPVNKHERMFLKHNCPQGPKPSFFHIEADFFWSTRLPSFGWLMLENSSEPSDDEDEWDAFGNDWMDTDDDFDEDAMDTDEDGETDEDGMDDAGVL